MSHMLPRILLVDDEQRFLNSIAERLKYLGFDPIKALSGQQALQLARKGPIDYAIVDYKMPGWDGLVTITKLKEIYPNLKTVLLTGHGSEKVKQATEALDAAYIEKDHMENFWEIIKDSSQKPSPQRKIVPLKLIGETRPIQELKKNIERLAGLDCPVIIRGETGTGKELTARMIHNLSPRRQHRFTAVNCGCFSNDLLTEELFRSGNESISEHGQQSVTGLASDAGGTLLLNHIEELPPKMQLSMLKIIDSKKISLQDGIDDFPLDVRIMAASHYDLSKQVEEGKLTDELYYRLNILELTIPPLRERKNDIPLLCNHFIHKFSKEFNKTVAYISEEVILTLMSYDFPGNVRELEHIIEGAVILADGDTINCKHLPPRFKGNNITAANTNQKFMTLAELEKQHILEVLNATGGNRSKTSELLGISRAALWRKLKQIEEEKRYATVEK